MVKKILKHVCIFICVTLIVMGLLYTAYKSFFDPLKGVPKQIIMSESLDTALTKAQAIEDLDYIINLIRNKHPACIDRIPDQVLEIYNNEIEQLQEQNTVLQLWQAASRILSPLKDGHTRSRYNVREYYRLPIDFTYSDHVLICTDPDYSNVPISKINDIDVRDLYNIFARQFSYELESYAEYNFAKLLSYDIYLEFIGIDTSSDIKITFDSGGDETTVEYSFEKYTPVEKDTFVKYDIDTDNSLGVFTLNQCFYNDEYIATLKDFFTQVKENNIQSIVIDLRENGGGTTRVINEFLRYLDIDQYYTGSVYIRYGGYMLKNKNQPIINHKYNDLLFSGKVYALTSTSTFSAAMDFAVVISDNNIGEIVGEIPGNMPTCYGDVLQYQTPNSKICVYVSYKYFIRADEAKSDQPLIPDYEVSAEEAFEKVKELAE